MKKLTMEESKREKKNFEMFEELGKVELNFIRGGDQPNTENEEDK